MVLDEPKQSDQIIVIENMEFLLDDETIKMLGERVNLDYRKNYGYRLSNNEEILSYGLQLKERK